MKGKRLDLSFDGYLKAQENNLAQIRRLPVFRELVLPDKELYEKAVGLVPPAAPPSFGRVLLLGHKGLLSAAALIARGLPDDAAGVTRRVIEAVRTGRAIKHDRANLDRWLAFEKRMARWAARARNARPKGPVRPALTFPQPHPVLDELAKHLGMLSDAWIHFTPEFLDQQSWREDQKGAMVTMRLNYFTESQAVIERELLSLGTIHLLCLGVLDECFDSAFSADEGWKQARLDVHRRGSEFAQLQQERATASHQDQP
ncbi:MAG: hypothetical protein HYV93_00590 [Candidatus Rokubacteria bacterium]|nr:hypothetical protein [Candidatus Rokubacteria bacterium]